MEDRQDTASSGSLKFISFADDTKTSSLAKYRSISVGDKGYGYLAKYELLQLLLSNLPGALGIFLRQRCYGSLFRDFGKRVIIGRGVCFRQPNRISIGAGSLIEDYSRLTVAGSVRSSISIGKCVFWGPFSICSSKESRIEIDDFATIGSHSRIGSMEGEIRIGQYVMIGAHCYIGGGNHSMMHLDQPMAKQSFESKGGVRIEDDVWLGAHVTVLDGVTIGKGAVVGACSLVTKDIPQYAIAYGIPARTQKSRIEADSARTAVGGGRGESS